MDKISNIYTDSHYSWFPSKFLSILHVLQKKWLEVMLILDWNCKNVIKLAHEACETMLYRPACFNFLKKLESRLEGLNTPTMPPCLLLIKAKINNIHSCTHELQVYRTQTGLMYGQRLQNLMIASTASPNYISLPCFQACAGATDTCRVFCLLVWRTLQQQQIFLISLWYALFIATQITVLKSG